MKKRIQIDGNGLANYGHSSIIEYAFVAGAENGRKMITPFYGCRDYINDTMISFYNKGGSHWNDGMLPLDTNYLRLLITTSATGKEKIMARRIYAAKRIINMYEELAKWPTKSIISRVDHNSAKIKYCWQLLAPKQWVHFSCLTSMLTLIFRVVQRDGGFSEFTTLEQVEERFKQLSKTDTSYSDYAYIGHSYPKFRMYMEEYEQLFGQYTPQELHPGEKLGNWHSAGGINSLSQCNTKVKFIDDNISKAWEKRQ